MILHNKTGRQPVSTLEQGPVELSNEARQWQNLLANPETQTRSPIHLALGSSSSQLPRAVCGFHFICQTTTGMKAAIQQRRGMGP